MTNWHWAQWLVLVWMAINIISTPAMVGTTVRYTAKSCVARIIWLFLVIIVLYFGHFWS